MDEIALALRDALVAAYRPYLVDRLASLGLPAVDDAISSGEEWLSTELDDLLARPYPEQPRSPLELFQEAMRFPTEALELLGAAPAERGEVEQVALPGDLYGLAPASSQELGEDAWRAHLAWGATKAASMRPSAVLVSRNLLDGSRVAAAAQAAGYRLVSLTGVPPGDDRFAVGFVDLEHPDADAVVRGLTAVCGRVVAYGPHVDDIAMIRARSLGASDAVPRSRFFRAIEEWLLPVV